jgi:hypothetical protein
MIELTDEILNKYIDGELDYEVIREIQEQINSSEIDKKRFTALQAIHNELNKIKLFEVKDDFTSKVMSKLVKKVKARKEDRLFIFSISSIFVVCCLAIIGYLLVTVVGSNVGGNAANQNIDNYVNYIVNILATAKEYLTAKNISIIGSVFSLGLIITGYFFFENLRQSKRRLSKMH